MAEALRIEWGSSTLSFLGGDNGIYLRDYEVGVPVRKSQQLSVPIFGEGGRSVRSDIGDAVDVITFDVAGSTRSEAIANLEALFGSAKSAVENYWWYNSGVPVWMAIKTNTENAVYGVIKQIVIDPKLPNIFARDFALGTSVGPGLISLQVSIERTPLWNGKSATVVPVSNEYTYYADMFPVVANSTYNYGSLFKTSSGTILAGSWASGAGTGRIVRSIDNGESFSLVGSHTNVVGYRFFQINNGDIIAIAKNTSGAGNFTWYRSTDDGATWSSFKTSQAWYSVICDDVPNSIVFDAYWDTSAKNIKIRYSTNNFTTFNSLATIQEDADAWGLHVEGDTIIFVSRASIWRSANQGSDWTKVLSFGEFGDFIALCYIGSRWIVVTVAQGLYYSDDDGVTWIQGWWGRYHFGWPALYTSTITNTFFEDGILYILALADVAGDPVYNRAQLVLSTQDGVNFDKVILLYSDEEVVPGEYTGTGLSMNPYPGIYGTGFVVASNGSIVYSATVFTSYDLTYIRRTPYTFHANSDENVAFVSNFHNDGNLLDCRYDDGGVYHAIPENSVGEALFPAVPVANDALELREYASSFLLNRIISPAFVFDLDEAFGSVQMSYKEYTGSFADVDRFLDFTRNFQNPGVGAVFFDIATGFTTVSTYYVCRFVLDAVNNVSNIPHQANNPIYAINRPYVDLDHEPGSIPSLMTIKAETISGLNDNIDQPRSTERLLVSSRSKSRGLDFSPFLPFSDVGMYHNDLLNIMVWRADLMSWGSGLTYTGRYSVWSPTSTYTTFDSVVEISITNISSDDYKGIFRVFLRGKVNTGSSGDITLRVGIKTGARGGYVYTEHDSFKSTQDWEVLDFGVVELPIGGDRSSMVRIVVEGKNSSGATRVVNLYDLILFPVDEFACDASVPNGDGAYRFSSVVTNPSDTVRFVVDGTDPRSDINGLVEVGSGTQINSLLMSTTGKPLIKDSDTRLWFFAMKYLNGVWVSSPFTYHKISVSAIKRFAGFGEGV